MEKIESPTSARPEREREGRRSKQVSRKISECKDRVRFKRKNKVQGSRRRRRAEVDDSSMGAAEPPPAE